MIPPFNQNGDLPEGVYKADIKEVEKIFGSGSARRKWLMGNLTKIISLAKSTNRLEKVFIWGSFVSKKEQPQDLDLLVVMSEKFNLDEVSSEANVIFSYFKGKLAFSADIFWGKSSIGKETLEMWLDTYQTTRDFKRRGIVEVIIDDNE